MLLTRHSLSSIVSTLKEESSSLKCLFNSSIELSLSLYSWLKSSAWAGEIGYFNEIFKHEAGLIMNFRFVELDLGVSLQGSDFKSSFKGAGIGAFVNFAVGF